MSTSSSNFGLVHTPEHARVYLETTYTYYVSVLCRRLTVLRDQVCYKIPLPQTDFFFLKVDTKHKYKICIFSPHSPSSGTLPFGGPCCHYSQATL